MGKKSSLKKPDYQDDFDFSEMMTYAGEEEAMAGMMNGLVEASRHQLEVALELTKLIAAKTDQSSMAADEILGIFQRASSTVAHNSVIRELWEKVNP